jgi:hypothetical protein
VPELGQARHLTGGLVVLRCSTANALAER